MTKSIGIVNYGLGNLASVQNAFDFLNIPCKILQKPADAGDVSHLLLPGVGAFEKGMANINNLGWLSVIKEHAIEHARPVLGICLGMQLLATDSEEDGFNEGLNLISGHIRRLERTENIRIPHVGWNSVETQNHALTYANIDLPDDFYFVHSYVYHPDNESDISGVCHHGQNFVASVEKDNIWGVQFHPEKSQKAGLQILENFWKL